MRHETPKNSHSKNVLLQWHQIAPTSCPYEAVNMNMKSHFGFLLQRGMQPEWQRLNLIEFAQRMRNMRTSIICRVTGPWGPKKEEVGYHQIHESPN